jgi:hypothetical protein
VGSVEDFTRNLRFFLSIILSIIVIGHGVAFVGYCSEDKLSLEFPKLLASGNEILSSGRGTFNYGPWVMDSDVMSFDRSTQTARLFGNVIVQGEGLTLSTMFVEYNIKSQTGFTGSLTGVYEPSISSKAPVQGQDFMGEPEDHSVVLAHDALDRRGFFRAHHADLHPNSKGLPELVLRSTSVSDCDAQSPHHDIFVGKLRWSEGKTVEAQHVMPRLMGIPYFYLPWAGRDLSHDWPWTRYTLGSKSNWGRFFTFESKIWPEETGDHLKLVFGARENRGTSLGLEWELEEYDHRQSIHLSAWQERYKQDDVILEDERWRLDWEERVRLNSNWDFNLDVHALDPRNTAIWTSGNARVLNQNLYANPFGANVLALQEREGLIEDYDEDQWERGRLLENEIGLDYHRNGRSLHVGSLQPSDGEQLRSRFKHGEIQVRQLPEDIGGGWLWSGEAGVGYQGQRLGWDLSDADHQTLGGVKRSHFETWRVNQLLRVERQEHWGEVSIKPYVGQRTIAYGDVLKDSSSNLEFYNFDEKTDLEGPRWAPRLLSGCEFDTLVSGDYAKGQWQHQIRPSMQFRFAGPSGLQQEQVVAEVDRIDFEKQPRFELLWGLQNEILEGQGRDRRLVYTQSISVSQLFRDEDRDELFGDDHRGGSDIRLHHSYYPIQNLNFYNEVRVNSFQAQAPWLRAGVELKHEEHMVNYGFNYLKDLRNPSEVSHRHDVSYRYDSRWDDFLFQVSWEGERQNSRFKNDEFYQKGFRRFDVVWGHVFHCLRTELEFEYDFEDSGATFIFRFGPDFFRESLPHYRKGFSDL